MDMCSTRFGSTMCRRQIIASSAATAIAVGFLLFGAVATAVAADLDADGLDDDWETRTGYSRTGDRDSDEDQLEDGDEWTFGTNPLDPDTDDDGRDEQEGNVLPKSGRPERLRPQTVTED